MTAVGSCARRRCCSGRSELGLPSFGANVANAPLNAALYARAPRRGRPALAADVGRRRGRARRAACAPSSSPKAVRCGRLSPSPPTAAPPSRARRPASPRGPGATRRRRLPPPSATRARTPASPPSCTAAPGPLTTVPLPGDASSLVWVEEPAAGGPPRGPRRHGLPGRAGGTPAGAAGRARRRRPARGVSACGPQRPCAWARTASPWSVNRRTSSRRSARRGSISACAMRQRLPTASAPPARAARTSAAPRCSRPITQRAPRTCWGEPSRSTCSTARCSWISCRCRRCAASGCISSPTSGPCAASSCGAAWTHPGACRA